MEGILEPSQKIITESVGPFLTGIMVQQLLMGVVIVQVYDYFRLFPGDSRYTKAMVVILLVVSGLQTLLDYLSLYRAGVTFFGVYDEFDRGDWKLWSEIGITALIGAISQGFFLERCYAATRSYFILFAVGLAVLASLGSGFAASVFFSKTKRISDMESISVPVALWLVSSGVIGIVMSVILILRLMQVRTEFTRTEAIVTRIVRLSFTTSSLTAAVTVVNVALYLGLPSTGWHLLPFFALGKIYTISVMVTLSSRKELRAIMDATGGGTVMMAGPRIAPSARLDFLTTPRPAVTGIKVSTTHTYHVDRNSAVDDGASQDIKLPLDTSDIQGASTFVVHRREASLSSKRSYSSSTYGPHMQELDFGEQEGGIEEEEIDMISVTGHGSNADRPFAPHPTVPVAIQATSEDGIVRKIVRPRTQDAVVGAVGASDVAVRPRATSKDANVMPIVVIEAS